MVVESVRRNRSLGLLLSVLCIIGIIAALRVAESFLIPVLVAFFLAQLSVPVTRLLRKRRVPMVLAVGLTMVVNIVVITAILMLCINLLGDFRMRVGHYIFSLKEMANTWGVELEQSLKLEGAEEVLPGLFKPQADAVLGWINRMDLLGRAASLASTTFFIFVLMVFMLIEGGGFGRRIAAIQCLGGPNFRHLYKVSEDIQKYLGIKTLVSLATGTLAGALTWALGVEFPLLWGMLAFVLNYIPAIGSVVAAVPPVLLALVQFDGEIWRSVVVLAGYLAINITLGNFLEPMLMGQRFGLSTLVVILSVLFWGWMWGPVGMFLAVPLTMLVKVILDNSVDFRWLSVAMGKEADEGELNDTRGSPVSGVEGCVTDPGQSGDGVPSPTRAVAGGDAGGTH